MDSPGKTKPYLMTGMLVIAIFFSMGSRVIFSPLMPILQREMAFSLSTAGLLFLLVNIIYGVAMLLSGFLSARIGHGNTIVAALITITLGMVLTALAAGVPLLAGGMLIIGAGAGIYPPSGIAMINTKISLKHRNTAYAFHEIGPNLALLLSPLIVLAFQPVFGRRGVLLWMAGVCALAAAAFLRWGAPDSGKGAAPNLNTLGTILRLRGVLLGIVVLSAAVAGMQGVYAILPAYLVTEYGLSPEYVNRIVSLSRVAGILLLLRSSAIIARFGRRNIIMMILLFSALCTALIGVVKGPAISLVVILQPALLALLFPPILSSIAEVGEPHYQNLTYAVVITAAVGIGGGAAPAVLGFFGDLGLGWIGFSSIALFMAAGIIFLRATPDFGRGHGSEGHHRA